EAFHGPGSKIVRDHVGTADDLVQDLPSAFRLHVEHDALLAGIARGEIAAAVDAEPPILERPADAHGVEAARALDLDDLGAEIRQDLGAEWSCPGPGQVADADTFEEARLQGFSSHDPSAAGGDTRHIGGLTL